jgi:hypothetical protein
MLKMAKKNEKYFIDWICLLMFFILNQKRNNVAESQFITIQFIVYI